MQELQLYIEGERLELFKDESVSLTQTIQNVKDVSKIFTSFTKTFSLPASKANNKIFKHYYNYNIVDGFDARIKKAGKIELNSLPYKSGRIKLEGVNLKNNLAHTYRITFFGNTVELPDIIGKDKLGELPFSSPDYTVTYNWQTIRAFLTSAQGNSKIIVPLITHSQRLFYQSALSAASSDNLWYSYTLQQGVEWNQLKYAIRLYEILLEIESKYTIANLYSNNIVFSRDFFSTSNLDFYNLYMWLHRKSGGVEAPSDIVTYTTITPSWTGSVSPIIRSGNTLTVPSILVTGSHAIDNYLIVTPAAGNSVEYQVRVNLGGVTILTTAFTTGTTSITNLNGVGLVANGVYSVTIIHNAAIVFSTITWRFEGFYRPTQTPIVYDVTASIGSFTATAEFDFIVAEQIPDVTVMSFLTGLFKMFNLVAYVEDSGTIVIRPLEGSSGIDYSYYTSGDIDGNDAPVNYDISKYVDTTTSIVNVALPYKEIIYEYEGTGTYLAKQHAQLFGNSWGTLKYIGGTESTGTGGENYNASTETYSVKVPFEHMKFERLRDVTTESFIDTQWGYSVNENQQPYIGKPLIFYAILKTSSTSISYQYSTTAHISINAYWIPSNSLNLNAALGTSNINLGLELNEWKEDTNFPKTLFAEYHSEYIIDVFNQSRRLTKVTAYLPLRILYNFKLNDTFTINSRNYIINSVTTNLQNGKSDMELLNKDIGYYNILFDIYVGGSTPVNYYYKASIGTVLNLSVGDVIYTNTGLTIRLSSGSYIQAGTTATTTYCDNGCYLTITVDSNGVITNLVCGCP